MNDSTLDDEIACARRELAMRERVYPRWIQAGRMTPEQSRHEIATMRAIVKRLERTRDLARPSLF